MSLLLDKSKTCKRLAKNQQLWLRFTRSVNFYVLKLYFFCHVGAIFHFMILFLTGWSCSKYTSTLIHHHCFKIRDYKICFQNSLHAFSLYVKEWSEEWVQFLKKVMQQWWGSKTQKFGVKFNLTPFRSSLKRKKKRKKY